jgi:D-lactate dehydrogenase (cytochrome)
VESACRLLRRARADSGDNVTSFEYICAASLNLVLANIPGCAAPLARPYPHCVLLELSSPAPAGSLGPLLERILERGMADGDVVYGAMASSEAQRKALWRLRETIPEAERREGGSIKHDISLAISRIPEFMARAPAAVTAVVPDGRISAYGHIGDGNVHFNVLPPAGSMDEEFRHRHGAAVTRVVHQLVADMNGSFSAEHGIGLLKRDDLATYKDPAALRVMRALKSALDPRGLMNPGKML